MSKLNTSIWLIGQTVVITIPKNTLKNKKFPFKLNMIRDSKKSLEPFTVSIKIDGKKLIIDKEVKK